MRKAWIICFVIAVVLLIVGGILFTAGIVRGGWRSFPDVEMTEHTEIFPADTALIRTDLRSSTVRVSTWDGDSIRIHWYDTEKEPLTLTTSGDVQFGGTVSLEDRNKYHLRFVWFDWDSDRFDVTVELPADFAGRMELETETGAICVRGIVTPTQPFSAEVSTGGIDLEDCAFQSVSATATTGGIRVSSVTCGSEEDADTAGAFTAITTTGFQKLSDLTACRVSIRSTTGSIQSENLNCFSLESRTTTGAQKHINLSTEQDVALHTTTGSVRVETLDAGGAVEISVTTGAIKAFGLRAGTALNLKASTGNITVTLYDVEKYYSMDCGSGTGNVHLPSFSAGGTVPLSVHTSTGDIRITPAE